MTEIEVQPVSKPITGSIRPPGSKSITNRAFIIAALAEGKTTLTGVLDSEDTRVMVESLTRLGFDVQMNAQDCSATVVGQAGTISESSADLFVENSGTSIRFLTAMCALGIGPYQLDGIARMRERPLGDLVNALSQLGANITYSGTDGFPPVCVQGGSLSGEATVAGNMSSQFLSGLLMMAPAATTDIVINVDGELVSKPYVEMTLSMMRQFGVDVDAKDLSGFRIPSRSYQAQTYSIEPDASAASYFFAAAAITGGRVTVEGLTRNALQGDVQFVDALKAMGCAVEESETSITVQGPESLVGIDIDMNAISDTAQTLAAVAVFADQPTTIRNVEHMRHKETDRVDAVANELQRLGIQTDVFADGLRIHPGPVTPCQVQTYNDHRMAMSFSLIGLKHSGIRIADPGCTAKTYPNYFEDLNSLCGYKNV
jgi:3-phosphoshikimate 1-carboxyvinyltransferase